MKAFKRFLDKKSLTTKGKLLNVGLALSFFLMWPIVASFISAVFLPQQTFWGEVIRMPIQLPHFPKVPNWSFMFSPLILAPFIEEFIFRVVPLKYFNRQDKFYEPYVVLAMSVIFAWMHGDTALVYIWQGVVGLILGIVYVKNNYSYKSAVFLHFFWNVMVSTIYF